MAKAWYIGNGSNLATKAKKMYIGDENNIARKVKKIYIGDSNNIARLCWSGGFKNIIYCTNAGYTYYYNDETNVLQSTFESTPFIASTESQYNRVCSVAYDGKNRLVCIIPNSSGNGGSITTSFYSDNNGVTWKPSTFDSTNGSPNYTAQQLTYCNGYFIVPYYYGYIAYSTDGINWEYLSIGANNKYKKVIYGNGKYITIVDSSSGVNYYINSLEYGAWGIMTNGLGICEAAYGNGIFVGHNEMGFYIYNEESNAWELVSKEVTASYDEITGMAYANGRFVFTTTSCVAYSDDGINWTKYNSGDVFIGSNYITSLSSNGELFFAGISVGNIAYSSDGVNWTIIDTSAITNGEITGICGI